MLTAGLALEAFKVWGKQEENLVLIPGYCTPGTTGHELLNGSKEVAVDTRGPKMAVRCQVRCFLARRLKGPHVSPTLESFDNSASPR